MGLDETEPHRIEVSFAQAFPSDDELGHFVISVCAAMNDLLLANKVLLQESEHRSSAERVALLRMVVGQVWEAVDLFRVANKNPVVRSFLDGLAAKSPDPEQVTQLLQTLRGQKGPYGGPLLNLLKTTRNNTWHYPKPGDAGVREALAAFADDQDRGLIRFGQTMESIRAEFADDVLLDIAFAQPSKVRPLPPERLASIFEDLSGGVTAIIVLAQWITIAYLNTKPGAWRELDPDEDEQPA